MATAACALTDDDNYVSYNNSREGLKLEGISGVFFAKRLPVYLSDCLLLSRQGHESFCIAFLNECSDGG